MDTRAFFYRSLVILSTATLIAAAPSISHADSFRSQPSSQAKESFDSAQTLFDEGRYVEALELFQRAYEATGSPNAHLMMARSLMALGKAPEAHEAMSSTLKEATALAETQPRYTPTRDAAAAELALLDRRLGKLIIALADPSPRGAGVMLNGRPVAQEKLGVPIAIEPGSWVVEVKGNGSSTRRTAVVGAGETKTLAFAHPKLAMKIPAKASVAKGGKEGSASSKGGSGHTSGARMAGLALGGVGVAGMIVFGVAGAAANDKFETIKKECGGVRCKDPIYGPKIDSGKTLDTVANTGLVVGLVGIGSGGALIALGGTPQAPKTALSVGVSLTGAKVGLKGRF